jgi:putative ABC transport system permease protein
LAKALPNDVRVLTHSQLDAAEREFWSSNTPIGFIFALGVFLGLVVGIMPARFVLADRHGRGTRLLGHFQG